MTTKVLMVCLGNICRSPTAHGIMEALIEKEGLGADIIVDSAGTGDWHIGRPPDPRTQEAAKRRGYDLSHLRARQVSAADIDEYDWVIAMDRQNRQNQDPICIFEDTEAACNPLRLGIFVPNVEGEENVNEENEISRQIS